MAEDTRIHLHRTLTESFCGIDISHVLATRAFVDTTCEDCIAAFEAELPKFSERVDEIKASIAELEPSIPTLVAKATLLDSEIAESDIRINALKSSLADEESKRLTAAAVLDDNNARLLHNRGMLDTLRAQLEVAEQDKALAESVHLSASTTDLDNLDPAFEHEES